jgi:predicted RNase H-like HicB family nuclease
MKYRVLLQRDEDGMFVAEVPALPGCISQGTTRAEALKNAHEAVEAYLESLRSHGDPVPPPIDEEVIEVNV